MMFNILVRKIVTSIKAFSEVMNLFDTIMTIYDASYQTILKQKLIKLLRTYDSFKNIQSNDFKIANNFPKCF